MSDLNAGHLPARNTALKDGGAPAGVPVYRALESANSAEVDAEPANTAPSTPAAGYLAPVFGFLAFTSGSYEGAIIRDMRLANDPKR